jgi:hypothetical protein
MRRKSKRKKGVDFSTPFRSLGRGVSASTSINLALNSPEVLTTHRWPLHLHRQR